MLGLTVDILYPNEDVQMSRVLGNISSRGTLYAIIIEPINEEHDSLTVNILHGTPEGKCFFVFVVNLHGWPITLRSTTMFQLLGSSSEYAIEGCYNPYQSQF